MKTNELEGLRAAYLELVNGAVSDLITLLKGQHYEAAVALSDSVVKRMEGFGAKLQAFADKLELEPDQIKAYDEALREVKGRLDKLENPDEPDEGGVV